LDQRSDFSDHRVERLNLDAWQQEAWLKLSLLEMAFAMAHKLFPAQDTCRTKQDKIPAKTASNCTLGCHAVKARRAFVYQAIWSKSPLE
jgi:hypothetical protein